VYGDTAVVTARGISGGKYQGQPFREVDNWRFVKSLPESNQYAAKTKAVTVRHVSRHQVVAMVEMISPANRRVMSTVAVCQIDCEMAQWSPRWQSKGLALAFSPYAARRYI
jgi:hypothetical protein